MAAIAAAITAAIAANIAATAPAARAVAAATAAGEIAAGAARRGTGDDRGRPEAGGGGRRLDRGTTSRLAGNESTLWNKSTS